MPGRLPSQRRVHAGVEGQQVRGHSDAQEEHALAAGKGAQGMEVEYRLMGGQYRPQRAGPRPLIWRSGRSVRGHQTRA